MMNSYEKNKHCLYRDLLGKFLIKFEDFFHEKYSLAS